MLSHIGILKRSGQAKVKRALVALRMFAGGPAKLDSMWQHRLTRPLHVQHTYYRII